MTPLISIRADWREWELHHGVNQRRLDEVLERAFGTESPSASDVVQHVRSEIRGLTSEELQALAAWYIKVLREPSSNNPVLVPESTWTPRAR